MFNKRTFCENCLGTQRYVYAGYLDVDALIYFRRFNTKATTMIDPSETSATIMITIVQSCGFSAFVGVGVGVALRCSTS